MSSSLRNQVQRLVSTSRSHPGRGQHPVGQRGRPTNTAVVESDRKHNWASDRDAMHIATALLLRLDLGQQRAHAFPHIRLSTPGRSPAPPSVVPIPIPSPRPSLDTSPPPTLASPDRRSRARRLDLPLLQRVRLESMQACRRVCVFYERAESFGLLFGVCGSLSLGGCFLFCFTL